MIESLVVFYLGLLILAGYVTLRMQKMVTRLTTELLEERGRVDRIKLVIRLVADNEIYDKIEEM